MLNRCFSILYLTVTVIIYSSVVRADDMGRIGDALEVGNPCNNYIITVERLIGGPPDRENYWDGTVNLQNYKNLTEAVITLYLTAPADVEVDEKNGQLLSNVDPYKMKFFKSKDDVFKAKFHVRPLNKDNYPTLQGLLLNDENICPINLQEESINHQTISGIQPECGHPNYMEENEHSSYASIYHNNDNSWRFECAGIYVTRQYVLTTGRCVSEGGAPLEPQHLTVRISHLSGELKNHSVFSVKVHDKYNGLDHSANIALLNLKDDMYDPIRSVCLWDSPSKVQRVDENQALLVSKNHDSNELMKSKASIVASNKCQADENNPIDGMICAEFEEHVDVCDAVGGSGLFVEKEHRFYLRGLLSGREHDYESNCRNIKHSIFVDVGEYADWIRYNSR